MSIMAILRRPFLFTLLLFFSSSSSQFFSSICFSNYRNFISFEKPSLLLSLFSRRPSVFRIPPFFIFVAANVAEEELTRRRCTEEEEDIRSSNISYLLHSKVSSSSPPLSPRTQSQLFDYNFNLDQLVIAHRGASGTLPDESLAAFELAILMGTNFVECDVVLTKDGEAICRHEPELSISTDVADRKEFADRYRKGVFIDGKVVSGFFSTDFTLAEIKTLKCRQPLKVRDQSYNEMFEVATLSEVLELIQRVNRWKKYQKHRRKMNGRKFRADDLIDVSTLNKDERRRFKLDNIESYFSSSIKSPLPEVLKYFSLSTLQKYNFQMYLPLVYHFFEFHEAFFSDKYLTDKDILRTPHHSSSLSSAFVSDDRMLQPVGVYIETKSPWWHKKESGHNMSGLLMKRLEEYGYTSREDRVYIQSFDSTDLEWWRTNSKFRLIQLIIAFFGGSNSSSLGFDFRNSVENSDQRVGNYHFPPVPVMYKQLETVGEIKYAYANLTEISLYAQGVGPDKNLIVSVHPDTNIIGRLTSFVEEAHSLGMVVHPYVLRNECMFLAFNYSQDPYMYDESKREGEVWMDENEKRIMFVGIQSYLALYILYWKWGARFARYVDGIFTDFPATALYYLEKLYCEKRHLETRHSLQSIQSTFYGSVIGGIVFICTFLMAFGCGRLCGNERFGLTTSEDPLSQKEKRNNNAQALQPLGDSAVVANSKSLKNKMEIIGWRILLKPCVYGFRALRNRRRYHPCPNNSGHTSKIPRRSSITPLTAFRSIDDESCTSSTPEENSQKRERVRSSTDDDDENNDDDIDNNK